MIVVYTEFHKYCRLYLSAIIVLDKVIVINSNQKCHK